MEGWHTKEDVIKDPIVANGLTNCDYDDDFIIRGNRPPPPPRHLKDEDEELEERYGKFGSHCHEILKPDYQGITKYIRMVNGPPINNGQEKKPEENKIVISKLNPHVAEFVPKKDMNVTNNSESLTNGVTTKAKIEDTSKELQNDSKKEESLIEEVAENIKEAKHEHSLEPCPNSEHTNRKSCDQNDDDKSLKKSELETILREKIIETAKAKTIKEKSARNVAIAALLKLKSGPPRSPITTTSSESKLSRSDSPASSYSNINSPNVTLILHPPNFYESKIPDPQADNVTSPPQSTESDNSSNKNENHKNSEEGTTSNLESAEVKKAVLKPEEQESIQKVTNWLNQPVKPKPVEPPHTGLINFKKRETAPITSPIVYIKKKDAKESSRSPVSETGSKKPAYTQPGAFVPSKYASDLAKKYEERVKANEDKQLDMWSKLERDLKARDEVVKERMKAKSETSPDDSKSSSRSSSRRQNHQ